MIINIHKYSTPMGSLRSPRCRSGGRSPRLALQRGPRSARSARAKGLSGARAKPKGDLTIFRHGEAGGFHQWGYPLIAGWFHVG